MLKFHKLWKRGKAFEHKTIHSKNVANGLNFTVLVVFKKITLGFCRNLILNFQYLRVYSRMSQEQRNVRYRALLIYIVCSVMIV